MFSGSRTSTMSRDDAWRFFVLGRSLERVDMTARLLAVAGRRTGDVVAGLAHACCARPAPTRPTCAPTAARSTPRGRPSSCCSTGCSRARCSTRCDRPRRCLIELDDRPERCRIGAKAEALRLARPGPHRAGVPAPGRAARRPARPAARACRRPSATSARPCRLQLLPRAPAWVAWTGVRGGRADMGWRHRGSCTRRGYRYDAPGAPSYNEVRLTPRTDSRQNVIVTPGRDHPGHPALPLLRLLGHRGHRVRPARAAQGARRRRDVGGRDRRPAAAGGRNAAGGPGRDDVRDRHTEMLEFTGYVGRDKELAKVARVLRRETTPVDAVHAACRWVHEHLTYRRGTTGVHTSALEAWEAGHGVCQDYVHLTLLLLREAGVPARYVSGYLLPDAHARVRQTVTGESHAWIEAWTGGWWGYDPTNLIEIGNRHVWVATRPRLRRRPAAEGHLLRRHGVGAGRHGGHDPARLTGAPRVRASRQQSVRECPISRTDSCRLAEVGRTTVASCPSSSCTATRRPTRCGGRWSSSWDATTSSGSRRRAGARRCATGGEPPSRSTGSGWSGSWRGSTSRSTWSGTTGAEATSSPSR